MALDDKVARLVALYSEMIDLPTFGLGSHKPRLYLAKQITAALEVMTIAEQERYYTAIHELRVTRAAPVPPDVDEVIEWG